MFDEVQVAGELATQAAKRLQKYVDRAESHAPSLPDIQGGICVTVSVEWLAWMIAFFEGDEELF